MKDVVGSPGTWAGLALRVAQCICAAASVPALATAFAVSTNNVTAFWYLIFVMVIQTIWSFILACVDIYALKVHADLHVPGLVELFVVGDWIMATNSFAAASASAGVAVFFARDTGYCGKMVIQQLCGQYKISVILAFATWSFSAASAASVFWVFASLVD